jgi:hypothetical protein
LDLYSRQIFHVSLAARRGWAIQLGNVKRGLTTFAFAPNFEMKQDSFVFGADSSSDTWRESILRSAKLKIKVCKFPFCRQDRLLIRTVSSLGSIPHEHPEHSRLRS